MERVYLTYGQIFNWKHYFIIRKEVPEILVQYLRHTDSHAPLQTYWIRIRR